MPSVAELLVAWRNKRVSGTALMRALVSYREWLLLLSEAAAEETLASNSPPRLRYDARPDGKKRLPLFSSDEAVKAYIGEPQHFLKAEGKWIFKLPLDGIDEIWIDPTQPEAIFYGKEHFGRLREFADAVAIEEDLSQLRQAKGSDEAVIRVREYAAYRIVINRSGNRLVMAPDQKGRTLAAIFTSEDACDAFLAETEGGPELQPLIYSGRALFEILSKMDLAGIVFNCSGPAPPVAFAAAFGQVVLEA